MREGYDLSGGGQRGIGAKLRIMMLGHRVVYLSYSDAEARGHPTLSRLHSLSQAGALGLWGR